MSDIENKIRIAIAYAEAEQSFTAGQAKRLADKINGFVAELERENATLREAAVELAAIGRVWITVYGDTLSASSVQRFAELEKQILKQA